ncbi:kinesin-like protein Klp61F [Contarinia nasturtii]|uniref:kinesin-like protein Klp61F n=1 Tax=Contarinia nasturtii TaxID=265458 RepID=UPI0012D49671|nr:kinesin-like protein Klp61F [Contarinia nasturtii]
MSEQPENIKIFVRLRPLSSTDTHKIVFSNRSNTEITLQTNCAIDSKYKFNTIFTERINQDEAFNVILVPFVRDTIQGYNTTLFSYGVTRTDISNNVGASTSIISMSTPNLLQSACTSISKSPQPPETTMNTLVSCALYRLFENLTQLELSSSVRISYLEIIDEELYDLLQPNNATAAGIQLKIFENDKNNVYVNGLTETTVHSAAEAMMIFRMAQKNARSVKSNSIFTVSIQSKEKPKFQVEENEELFKFRKMCLVQLGSQESQKKSARAKTVQSLTGLNRVVQALINKQTYIPYRDSKLTRIMQESLGGNAKTAIVASIGSGNGSIEETIQALEFLNRMKCITNHPKINERLDDARTLNEMAMEIRKLKMDIEANINKTGHFLTDDMYVNYQNEIHTTKTDMRRRRQELLLVHEEGADLNCTVSNVNTTLCAQTQKLEELQSIASTKQKQSQILCQVSQQRGAIIDRYISTEKTVTQQANDITATVQEVLADKTNLDASVARYKLVDQQLIDTVREFQTDMQHKLDNLKIYSAETRANIDVKVQKTIDLEKTFLRNASLLNEVIKTKSLLLLQQLEVNLTKETSKCNDIKSEFSESLLSYLKESESNSTLYKGFACELEEQSNLIEAHYKELRELYVNHFITINNMIDDIKQRMAAHGKKSTELIGAMRLTISECAEIGTNIDDKMELIYEQMREIVHQIQQNASDIKNSVEPVLMASEKNVQEAKVAIVESLNAHLITVNEQKALLTQPNLSDDLKLMQSELKNTVEQTVMLANNSLEKLASNNTFAIEQNQKCVETISTNLPSKRYIMEAHNEIPSLRDDLNRIEIRISDNYKENSVVLDKITVDTQQMSKKINQEIDACHKQLKFFREIDFSEYTSSGETPVKREYQTKISLAATTPLEKIKQRFRDRLSQMSPSTAEYSFLNE